MTAFKAVHNYTTDEVFLPAQQCTLQNQYDATYQIAQTSSEKEHETKEGDDEQSPVRGVLTKHHPENLQIIDTPIPVETQHTNAGTHEQLPTSGVLQVEERTTIMGDRVESPSREVPNTTFKRDEPPADNIASHSVSIKEVEDNENPKHRARESEETKTTAREDQTRHGQEVNNEKQEHQRKQAKERASKEWK